MAWLPRLFPLRDHTVLLIAGCKFTSETFFDIAAIVLIGIWNAVGTNWTFPFWDTVVYEPESSPDYCPRY